jgi:hypothetical protein
METEGTYGEQRVPMKTKDAARKSRKADGKRAAPLHVGTLLITCGKKFGS